MTFLLVATALSQDYPTCPQELDQLDGERYLRALSLDLRGIVPTAEEYELLDEDGHVPDEVVVDWMNSPEFSEQVVRHHRSMLWPNVSDIRLLSNRQRLEDDDYGTLYRYLVAPHYRGGPISCGDFETQFDDDGEMILVEGADGTVQEGYVWVEPYWDPENPIKVCGFGAQEAAVSPWGTECNTYDSRYDPYCGCGPNLAWCDTPELGHNGGNPNPPVATSIAREAELRVARVVEQDLSYLELLTGRSAYVNGPLAHFYRYQTQAPAHVRFNEVPVDPDLLPEIPFTEQDTWVEVELGPEQSGILTSTLYLMKFQTRRGRTNRFYNAFLCEPFQPPVGGLSDLDDPEASLDLTQRPGCKYCHAVLEPAGAHWGRWGEYSAGYLEPEAFPAFSEDCEWCAQTGASCSSECERYYVVDPLTSEEDPYVGWLLSYEFLEERHWDNAEQGPKYLVHSAVADGRLPRCVARNTAEWLLDRPLEDYEEDWVDELASDFAASDFDYEVLVHDIVISDNYRRLR